MGDIAHGALDTTADLAKAFAGIAHHQPDQRPQGNEDQGQLPVGVDHEAQQADDGQPFPQDDGHRVGGRIRHLLHIEGELGDQAPRGMVVEVAGRQG